MAYTSCEAITLSSIDARCDKSIGGIKRVLVGDKDYWDITIGAGTGEVADVDYITNIVKAGGVITPKPFVEFKFRRNTGSYTSTVANDIAIGNSFATTELSLQFSKAEAKKRMYLQSLINAGNSIVIIEDMYGQYIFLGKDREVVVTNATMASGTAETDLNGFTLTLQDISEELPYFISSDFDVDSLLTASQSADNVLSQL